jgi:hypothetical protein
VKENVASCSGIFNPRILTAFLLCSAGAWLGMFSLASTPSSGTLTDTSGPVTYDAGPFNVPNKSPLGFGQLDVGPRCNSNTFPCDNFALTVSLPSGYAAAHPNGAVKVTMYWTDTGSGKSDYDLYIYNGVVGDLNGSMPADHQSATRLNPEVAVINPLIDGDTKYSLKIVPNTPTQELVHVRIELLPGTGGLDPNFGGADATAPGVPRYHIFEAPPGSTAEATQGEFNIGFDPHTGRIMVMNIGPIWRLTPPELLTPSKPECCEALWEDKSATVTNTGLDPILWTDQKSGRTFASNSTAGANAVYAFTDAAAPFNDGDKWVPFSPSPPSFSDDHETIGSGPYPLVAGMPNPLATAANQGEAVYYCGQTFPVGSAECQRSDNLGVSYGPGVPVYNGTTSACHGLHGHVHVAPDGTVWLPVNHCGGAQGGALSTTSGATWQEFTVTGSASQQQGADPSIGIDSDSTVYYAYVNNEPVPAGNPPEGHAHVKVSHDHGATWINDFDLGASHGIKNAVEIEAVGGSSGRAAVGFLGTNVNGDYQANSFPGNWYAFIATTYDGGQTWTTVNATPKDPVQSRTGVWQAGGGHLDRNLLDFNEITVDDKGRVLYGYSDGCVTSDCIAGAAPNDFGAKMRVARQSGGKSIFASFDNSTDTTAALLPKPPCLSGTRDPVASHLLWKVPDNGGSGIINYQVFRGLTSGSEQLIGQTGGPKPSFDDATADPSVAHYFYYVKAINAVGTGAQSNEIDLVVAQFPAPESICTAPGLTKLTDPAGDTSIVLGLVSTPAPPGADLKSFQIAQPFQVDGVPRLIFTINTWDNGQSPQPVGSSWYLAMKIAGPDPAVPNDTSAFHYRAVHMTWTGPTPTFESYTPAPNASGGVDGRFVTAGSQKPAEPSSSYASPFNQIVIVVKASDLGLNPGDMIAGFVSAVSQTTNPVGMGPGATALYDQMPNSLNFAASYVVNHNNICATLPPGIVSRQVHGPAGPFDINLPQTGSAGIECRSGGANGAYTLVYTFANNVQFAGAATVTQGTANVGPALIGPKLNQVSVLLTNVANAQHLIVNLRGVQDATRLTLSLTARMDVLVGDVNASGLVDSGDVFLVRQQTGQTLISSNFRGDVNASGLIDSGDVFLTRQHTGTSLP